MEWRSGSSVISILPQKTSTDLPLKNPELLRIQLRKRYRSLSKTLSLSSLDGHFSIVTINQNVALSAELAQQFFHAKASRVTAVRKEVLGTAITGAFIQANRLGLSDSSFQPRPGELMLAGMLFDLA